MLLGFFRFIFDCRHRHQSRVFTIKHRTYRVCFDCGREFELPDAHSPVRSEVSPNARLGTNPNPHHAKAFAIRPELLNRAELHSAVNCEPEVLLHPLRHSG